MITHTQLLLHAVVLYKVCDIVLYCYPLLVRQPNTYYYTDHFYFGIKNACLMRPNNICPGYWTNNITRSSVQLNVSYELEMVYTSWSYNGRLCILICTPLLK